MIDDESRPVRDIDNYKDGENPDFDFLRRFAKAATGEEYEYGILMRNLDGMNDYLIHRSNGRSDRVLSITNNYYPRDRNEELIFFHTHPGFSTSGRTLEFALIPSIFELTQYQANKGDIGASAIDGKRNGGYLNIINSAGVTLYVGYEEKAGLRGASRYLNYLGKPTSDSISPKNPGKLSEEGDYDDIFPEFEVIDGSVSGKNYKRHMDWAKDAEGKMFNDNGFALYRIVDKFSGKIHTFLSIDWDSIPDDLALEDLLFGNGLYKLADSLGISRDYLSGSNLNSVMTEESRIVNAMTHEDENFSLLSTRPKVLKVDKNWKERLRDDDSTNEGTPEV